MNLDYGMAVRKLGAQVLESIADSAALSEVVNDAQSEWVAANAGEMFAEQVGGSTDIAGGRGADHFDVMALQLVRWPPVELGHARVMAARSATASPKPGSAITAWRSALTVTDASAACCARR